MIRVVLFAVVYVAICLTMLPGCAFHYKTVNVEVDTPSSVRFGDVRNENLSEGITASPRLQGAENVNAGGK